MRDALKLQAERAPNVPVEGWTDRPVVAPEFATVWHSYCDFVAWRDFTLASIDLWVKRRHWRESADGQAILFGVFERLVQDRLLLMAETTPPEQDDDRS